MTWPSFRRFSNWSIILVVSFRKKDLKFSMTLLSGSSSDFQSFFAWIVARACLEEVSHFSAWSSKNFLESFTILSFFIFIQSVWFPDARASKHQPNLNNKFGIPTFSIPSCLTTDLTAPIIAFQCKGSIAPAVVIET